MTTYPALRDLELRPLIMGVLNVTPDSFSGDGLLAGGDLTAAALQQAERMVRDGADLLDVGGESSRPGSIPVSVDEEIRRTIPVLTALHAALPSVPLSIDTVKPRVAAAALESGASIINDVAGDNQDPAMLALAAKSGAYLVLMHNGSKASAVEPNRRLGTVYTAPVYQDVVEDVLGALNALATRAIAAGIAPARIILDPGLGFGKTVKQNLRLINELDKLKMLGFPVLVGPSRKGFIGRALDLPVDDRLEGTAAVVTACVLRGAAILRVHDVKEMARTAKMAVAIRKA